MRMIPDKDQPDLPIDFPPFHPPRWLHNGHLQTVVASRKPRLLQFGWREWEPIQFDLEKDGKLSGEASWQPGEKQESPVLILFHGLEGSAQSHYLVGMSKKAYQSRFHTIRINTRNCGGTEHLTPSLYCAGLSQDIRAVTCQLRQRFGFDDIYAAGVSLGANILLKFVGETGDEARQPLQGVAVLSPPIDLLACALKMLEPQNWIYQRYFVRRLKERMRRKIVYFPEIADMRRVEQVRTIYEFDDVVTAPHFGFGTAKNYYRLASSAPLLEKIRTPTLIIQSQDDPMIPFGVFHQAGIENNPHIRLLPTDRGGHSGFLAARPATEQDQDCYWAESRVVQFLSWLAGRRGSLRSHRE